MTTPSVSLADQIEKTGRAMTADELAHLLSISHHLQASEGRTYPVVPHRDKRAVLPRRRSELAAGSIETKSHS